MFVCLHFALSTCMFVDGERVKVEKTREFERVLAARFILTRNSATGTMLRQWPYCMDRLC
jgi:hypothetical protein